VKQCLEFSHLKFYLVQFSYVAINARQGIRKPTVDGAHSQLLDNAKVQLAQYLPQKAMRDECSTH